MMKYLLAAMFFGVLQPLSMASEQPNILFIAVDDLRPELGCYGTEHIKTPNIDRLATGSSTFLNSYCSVPTCGASRASLMSSIRPIPGKRFMSYKSRADKEAPEYITLPQHFKNNGYTTISNGKVFHHIQDSVSGWSEEPYNDIDMDKSCSAAVNYDKYWKLPENKKYQAQKRRGPYYERADISDSEYPDGKIADKTIADLKRLKDAGKPFFVACGFIRPHLPMNAPKKYFDLYDRDKLPLETNRQRIVNLPKQCGNSNEVNSYALVKEDKKSGEFERNIRHGYFACVSFIDAQIGRILDTLDELDLADNTIVVLWGDHGWHLGEHTFFGKHNTLDNATRAPLIIKAPGVTKGDKLEQLAEFVDIYPTLCELAALETPEHCQGVSLKPVLSDTTVEIKDAVYIAWKNCHTIKTKQFAYTEFVDKQGNVINTMLFDHTNDREENVNVVNNPEYCSVIEKLSNKLNEYNR